MSENQKFGLKIGILLLKLIKEVTNITTLMIKKREHMFKRHSFKIFRCNSTDPSFNTHKFLGGINSYITKLFEKEAFTAFDD